MQTNDTRIVKAAIYPAIGIARVGNSKDEYYIGPQVLRPEPRPASDYKDASGALKREAALFRIYGLNAAGGVVRELTADEAAIRPACRQYGPGILNVPFAAELIAD